MKRRDWMGLAIVLLVERVEAMNGEPSLTLVEHTSETGFQMTMERLITAITAAGMTVFARVDHAAAARSVGLTMPPTEVVFYGNPKGGTPVMLATPRAALELPLRVLLREGNDGKAILSFHPIAESLRSAGVGQDMAERLAPGQQLMLTALRA